MLLNPRRGVALIIVMIVVSGLSILAFGLAFRARVRMKTFELNVLNTQAYHLAIGGIEKGKAFLADNILTDDPQEFDLNVAKRIPFVGQLSDEDKQLLSDEKGIDKKLEYAVFDESGFININKTNPVNLMKLEQIDETLVARILDWKDKDNELSLPDSVESDFYMQKSRPYVAKNEEFSHLRELLFIEGIEVPGYLGRLSDTSLEDRFNFFDARYDSSSTGLVNIFTVHGDGMLNINTTSALVLASLPGIDLPLAEAIAGYRRNLAGDECLSGFTFLDDMNIEPNQKTVFGDNCNFSSNIFRIYSFGKVDECCCCFMAIVEYNENKLKTLSLERLF